MSDSDDFSQLDDVAFLAERRRVREELEHTPQNQASPELTARYDKLNEEFLSRASAAWAQALGKGKLTMGNITGLLARHSHANHSRTAQMPRGGGAR